MNRFLPSAIIIIIFFIISSPQLRAQTPSWQWAYSAGSTGSEMATASALDASGNLYVTGWYTSASITFGTNTFINQGSFTGDMFLVKYNPSGTVLWAKSFGAADGELGNGVATDAAGNVYITGLFASPTLAIGSVTLVNSTIGNSDIYVAKIDPNGNTIWAKSTGGTQADRSNAIAVDTSGNVFITGNFISPVINFGTGNLTNAGIGTTDVFVAKLDNNGTALWAKNAGGTGSETGNGIAVDSLGNSYVTGSFNSASVNFGTGPLNNAASGSQDVFIVKYNGAGTAAWSNSAGGSLDDYGNAIKVKSTGVFITGGFNSASVTIGTNTLTNASAGTADVFLTKQNLSGTVQWAKRAGGTDSEAGNGVSCDSMGNVFITGYYSSSSILFGTTTLTNFSFGYRDLFVASFSGNGNALWATEAGSTYDETSNCISVHPNGVDVYIGGTFNSGSVSFGAYNVYKGCGDDVFVAKLLGPLVGVAEYKNIERVKIYPNPASEWMKVESDGEIILVDFSGKLILKEKVKSGKKIDVSQLPKGIYSIRLIDNDNKIKTGNIVLE